MTPRAAAGVLAGAIAALAACGSTDPVAERAAERRRTRAYEGAPPVIPHAVAALGRQDCLSCHKQGMELPEEGRVAATPHPELVACAQCHVEQVATGPGLAENRFVGLVLPARGERAYPGAPPTIPHGELHLRENCLGCHGAYGGSPIRTSHPERVACRQCHVPARPSIPPWRPSRSEGP